jgi:hypothetical protein
MFRKPTTRSRCYLFFGDVFPLNGPRIDLTDPAKQRAMANALRRRSFRDALPNSDPPMIAPVDTNGGGMGDVVPPGMMPELVASFRVEGDRFAYWPASTATGLKVWQQELGCKDGKTAPMRLVGNYPLSTDAYLWTDQNTTVFRVWRAQRSVLDQGNTSPSRTLPNSVSPGTAVGRKAAQTIGDNAAFIRRINQANRKAWG